MIPILDVRQTGNSIEIKYRGSMAADDDYLAEVLRRADGSEVSDPIEPPGTVGVMKVIHVKGLTHGEVISRLIADKQFRLDGPHHVTKTLPAGEMVYLTKPPAGQWEIRLYEYDAGIRLHPAGGLVFESRSGLPEHWREKTFESPDAAEAFVKSEIAAGKIAGNKNRQ